MLFVFVKNVLDGYLCNAGKPIYEPCEGQQYLTSLKIGAEVINFKFDLYALYDRGVQYIL